MALWSRFFGSAGSQAVGVAMGAAAVPALIPYSQDLINAAWRDHSSHPLLASVLAEGVAQGQIAYDWAQNEATNTGINKARFDQLVAAAKVGPGIAEAFDLWRRDVTDEAGFRRALRRLGLENEWIDDLVKVKQDILSMGEIAAAIHRGLIPDPGLLQGEQPSGLRKVASYPVYQIDADKEAAGHGYDHDRLGVLVGLQGLPMGTIEAAQAYYRNIITRGDYIAAFNESNNRNEWAQAVLDYARQIPTARDFIENALRGYRTLEQAQEGAALHGMSPEHARLIFQNSGRPLNLHQITQALAWGAKYNPLPGDDPDPYMNAVLIGPVTPAYYEMQDTLKYNLPSAFFFRVLQQNGVLTTAEAETWYKRMGWPPELATKVAEAFGATASGGADSWVKRAQTQFWTTTHASYKANEMDGAEARNNLAQLGITGDAANQIVQLWDYERDTIRKQLTPAQLVKAFKKAAENPATAAPYTRQDVIDRLIGMGYLYNDAVTLIDESL